jgi:hypothetical protein
MTPKEKAEELFCKYMKGLVFNIDLSDDTFLLNKKFAIIVADEFLEYHKDQESKEDIFYYKFCI